MQEGAAKSVSKGSFPCGLVLMKPIGSKMEPYTTADTVAQYAQVRHKTVNELIRKHEKDLEEFGTLRFEMEAVKRERGVKYAKVYHLNEQQATLLITYLRNTEPVRQFKKALVRGFYEARRELSRREVERAVKAPVRRTLTDAIRDSGEAKRMNGHAYNAYTNMIYKAVTGKTAGQLRKNRGAARGADVVGLLSAAELAEVRKKEAQVCTLLECGMKYDAIRAVIHAGTRKPGPIMR